MKLRKAGESEDQATTVTTTTTTGGAAIAARYRLDTDANVPQGPAGVNKTAALIALLCSLASLAMMGTVAALLYQNWELIQNV